MKKIISLLLSTLILFVSVFSHLHLSVIAAPNDISNWDKQPYENGYAYITNYYKNNLPSQEKLIVEYPNGSTPGVYQGENNTTFALNAPVATIYIDEDRIHNAASDGRSYVKVEPHFDTSDPTKYESYLRIGAAHQRPNDTSPGYDKDFGHNYLIYDNKEARKKGVVLSQTSLNQITDPSPDKPIVSYVFEDAARIYDDPADVVITFYNLRIALINGQDYSTVNEFLVCSGNRIQTGTNSNSKVSQSPLKYGMIVNARVRVRTKAGTYPQGIFYFKAADIDIFRTDSWIGGNDIADRAANYNYAEQIRLNSGYNADNGYAVYLPGGEADKEPDKNYNVNDEYDGKSNSTTRKRTGQNPPGYKTVVDSSFNTNGSIRFKPQTFTGSDANQVKDQQESIYSGFLAAINNSDAGADVTIWSNGSSSADVATYLLAGNAGGKTTGVYYNLKATTETVGGGMGGNIQTTSLGNQTEDLSDGGSIIGPKNSSGTTAQKGEFVVDGGSTITVSGGRTMTYTMTPNSAEGYVLKSLTVKDGSTNYQDTGSYEIDLTSATRGSKIDGKSYTLNGSELEELSYKVDIIDNLITGEPQKYIFTFKNIQQDHAIHVVWQKKHWETYEFKMDNGSAVPTQISALLPERSNTGKEKRFWENETIAPASPWDHVADEPKHEVVIDDGSGNYYKYTFLRYEDQGRDENGNINTSYDPSYKYTEYNASTAEFYTTDAGSTAAPRDTVRSNIHFIGYWSSAPAYTEEYEYQYEDETGNPLTESEFPSRVTGSLPGRHDYYADGEDVYPVTPSVAPKVEEGAYTYKFMGWSDPSDRTKIYDTQNPATINGRNVKFIGIWKKILGKTYNAKYEYENSSSLPDAVKATIPYDAQDYHPNDSVTSISPSKTSVIVGTDVYIFEGWDNPSQSIPDPGADVVFVGKWRKETYIPPSPGGGTPGGGGSTPSPGGGGGGIGGGGDEDEEPGTPAPVDPGTPPVDVPDTFVPSTETSGTDTADGTTGLTVVKGEEEELEITPVLPEGVDPGPLKIVTIDGVPLDPSLYTVKGTTVVLSPAYLSTLPEGTHVARLVYGNVWTEAQFAVLGARRPSSMTAIKGARTYDVTYGLTELCIVTGLLSAGYMGVQLYRRRRNR